MGSHVGYVVSILSWSTALCGEMVVLGICLKLDKIFLIDCIFSGGFFSHKWVVIEINLDFNWKSQLMRCVLFHPQCRGDVLLRLGQHFHYIICYLLVRCEWHVLLIGLWLNWLLSFIFEFEVPCPRSCIYSICRWCFVLIAIKVEVLRQKHTLIGTVLTQNILDSNSVRTSSGNFAIGWIELFKSYMGKVNWIRLKPANLSRPIPRWVLIGTVTHISSFSSILSSLKMLQSIR